MYGRGWGHGQDSPMLCGAMRQVWGFAGKPRRQVRAMIKAISIKGQVQSEQQGASSRWGPELCEGPTTAEDPEEVDHDVFSQRGSFLWSCIPGYMPALDQDRPWLQMLQTWRKTTGNLEAAGQWWLVIAHVLLLFIALPLVLLWMRNSRHENPGCLLATSSD